MDETQRFQVYFAGDLFDHKDLVGNALLAQHIASASDNRYHCVLPQDLEQSTNRAALIRNQDLLHVIHSDLALFNFDGDDLDSGTVVEFMLAKMLDIPALILRSDFRVAGDQRKNGDSWNLMCSFYPRSLSYRFNAMTWYQNAHAADGDIHETLRIMYPELAARLVAQLDDVRQRPSLFAGDIDRAQALYEWALTFPGGGLADLVDPDDAAATVARKHALGLI